MDLSRCSGLQQSSCMGDLGSLLIKSWEQGKLIGKWGMVQQVVNITGKGLVGFPAACYSHVANLNPDEVRALHFFGLRSHADIPLICMIDCS